MVKIGFLLFCAAALAVVSLVGCGRTVESREAVPTHAVRGPDVVNFVLMASDEALTLSWETTDTASVALFRVYYAGADDDEFFLLDSATSFSITLVDLEIDQVYLFQIRPVLEDGVEWDGSEPIFGSISRLALSINGGDEFCNQNSVTIGMTAPASAAFLQLSEDSTFASVAWLSFATSVAINLSEGDGVKTVYGRVRFTDGYETGDLLFDDITLDTYAQIDSVWFEPADQAFVAGETATFFVAAGETGGVAQVTYGGTQPLTLNDAGADGDELAGDSIYSGGYVFPQGISLENGEVTGSYTDVADNVATALTSALLLSVGETPGAVVLTAEALSNSQVVLNWTASTAEDFSSYRIYRSSSDDVTEGSTLLGEIGSAATTTYEDSELDDAVEYFYRVYVVSSLGLSTGSNIDSATTLVNAAPQPVILTAIVGEDTTVVDLSWTENEDVDFEMYHLHRALVPGVTETNPVEAIVSERATLEYQALLPPGDEGDSVYYRVLVIDRQGASAFSNEVSAPRPVQAGGGAQ